MHHTINHTEEQMTTAERIRNFCSRAKVVAKHLSHEAYIHGRRLAYAVHEMSAEHPSSGPISFLGVSLALAAALTVTTLYSSSYKVMVDGQYVGVVNEQEVVTDAKTVDHFTCRIVFLRKNLIVTVRTKEGIHIVILRLVGHEEHVVVAILLEYRRNTCSMRCHRTLHQVAFHHRWKGVECSG